jgi:hypothetical protein
MDRDTQLGLRRLAEGQRGLFSAAQAAQFGIGYPWLCRAVARGDLRRSRAGVYAVRGTPLSRWEPMLAAALAIGPRAVISHASAACAYRLHGSGPVPSTVEISVPRGTRPELSGVTIHWRASLPKEDLSVKHGALITTPARTFIDLAGRLEPGLLAHTLDEGLLQRRWTKLELVQCLERAPSNLAGRRELRRLFALRMEGPIADSALEVKVFAALTALAPLRAHYVTSVGSKTYVIDAAWPGQRVGAEIVGRAHRVASRSAFDRERRKLNELTAAGWRIAHLTAAMSTEEMVGAVRALLGPTR